MSVKIRLARHGRKKKPFYHIVVADARSPRDGKFIEKLGVYNPMTKPATIDIDRDKAFDWIMKGAQPTDTARAILGFKGIYYRKHLQRGVTKGALTQEKADEMYKSWIDAKEAKIAERVAQTRKEKEDFWKMVSGEVKAKQSKKGDEAAAEAFKPEEQKTLAEQAEEKMSAEGAAAMTAGAAVVEAVTEDAPAAKEEVKTAVEEAPAVEEVKEVVEEVKAEAEEVKAEEKPAEGEEEAKKEE